MNIDETATLKQLSTILNPNNPNYLQKVKDINKDTFPKYVKDTGNGILYSVPEVMTWYIQYKTDRQAS